MYSYQDMFIDVTVTDSSGHRFDNFSSLAFDWEVSNPVIAGVEKEGKLTTELSTVETSRRIMTC